MSGTNRYGPTGLRFKFFCNFESVCFFSQYPHQQEDNFFKFA